MLFNSIEFMLFLPIVFMLYWFVFRERRLQNFLILVASYVFYGWWDWRFLFLIALTSFCSYGSGLLINLAQGRRHRQWLCASNILINLAILMVFKYYDFFIDSFVVLVNRLGGARLDWPLLNVILPVGISFYTFQALSYTIDVYQRKLPATRDIVEFFAYISFFPQLVAGPIERAVNLLPQFQQSRRFNYALAADGCQQMLWGFFKKIVIADNCATVVNAHWDSFAQMNGLSLLVLGTLFTFQIYCDFSGYSDIAIGCARLFGFNLMRNFNVPYFSRSIHEFWTRWHISLTTWFRDYIYFPLGGSRCDLWMVVRNIYIVWFISGLWHGAKWTFICWGLYHATLIVSYRLLGVNTKYQNVVAHGRFLPTAKEALQMAMTFFLTVVGFIIFRAEGLTQAWRYLIHMFSTLFDDYHIMQGESMLIYGFLLLLAEWLQRDKQHAMQLPRRGVFALSPVRYAIYVGMIFTIYLTYMVNIERGSEFVYFQF